MPTQPRRRCTTPGCPNTVDPATGRGRCPQCRYRTADKGYKSKTWERDRLRYLAAHPACVLCGQLAAHRDHWPLSRRQLLARRDKHPDAWHHLRPLCASCHASETWKHQPPSYYRR